MNFMAGWYKTLDNCVAKMMLYSLGHGGYRG